MSKDSNNFPKQSRTFKRNTNPKVPNLLNHSNNKIKKNNKSFRKKIKNIKQKKHEKTHQSTKIQIIPRKTKTYNSFQPIPNHSKVQEFQN